MFWLVWLFWFIVQESTCLCAMFFPTSEKNKENDPVENDGSITLSSVNTASVESENQDVTNADQLRRKSPDEVCVIQHHVDSSTGTHTKS